MYINVVYESDQAVLQKLLDSQRFLAHLCRTTERHSFGSEVQAVSVKLSCYEGGYAGWQREWTKGRMRRKSMCRDSSHAVVSGVNVLDINAPLDWHAIYLAKNEFDVAKQIASAVCWAIENALPLPSSIDKIT
ncbi:hypothetical protein DBR42_01400 [Pelomonas sp. HMWF004]|nr:hypothetical protein DBR42_01400 [Pelomonas sp. HMWF004]